MTEQNDSIDGAAEDALWELDKQKERAEHNTEHNKKHGIDQVCDGYCATDECVCGLISNEKE